MSEVSKNTVSDGMKKVISLYMEESYSSNTEVKAAIDAYTNEIQELGADTFAAEEAFHEVLALTERFAFTDGFMAGVTHMRDIHQLGRE